MAIGFNYISETLKWPVWLLLFFAKLKKNMVLLRKPLPPLPIETRVEVFFLVFCQRIDALSNLKKSAKRFQFLIKTMFMPNSL